MPAVVSFWRLPEDEEDFLGFLQTTGDIVAMPDHWVKAREDLLPQPLISYIERYDPPQLLLGLGTHAQRAPIEPKGKNGERFFAVAYMSPCLIGYRRGRFRDGNKLTKSNLCTYWDYPNEGATQLLDKDPEFIKWAKKVLAWTRKVAPKQVEFRGGLCRGTNRVKEAVQLGQVELVEY